MKSAFQITGFEEYFDSLRKAGEDINKVSREALAEVGNMLEGEMKSRCESEELKQIITQYVPSGTGDYNYRRIGIIHDLSYTTKRQMIKAIVIEFGGVHWAARPFIRPAIRAKRAAAMKLIQDRLRAAALVD